MNYPNIKKVNGFIINLLSNLISRYEFQAYTWNQRHLVPFKFEAYLSLLPHPMSTAAADCHLPFHEMPQMTDSLRFIKLQRLLQKGAGLWLQDKPFIILCSFISL